MDSNSASSLFTTPLTITADDQTKVYGAALPTLTASYTGFVNGDTAASLTTPADAHHHRHRRQPRRRQPLRHHRQRRGRPRLHDHATSPARLTVTPAPLTITADNQTKVYGAALPTLTASYTGLRQRRHLGQPDHPADAHHHRHRRQPRRRQPLRHHRQRRGRHRLHDQLRRRHPDRHPGRR